MKRTIPFGDISLQVPDGLWVEVRRPSTVTLGMPYAPGTVNTIGSVPRGRVLGPILNVVHFRKCSFFGLWMTYKDLPADTPGGVTDSKLTLWSREAGTENADSPGAAPTGT